MKFRHAMIFAGMWWIAPSLWGQGDPAVAPVQVPVGPSANEAALRIAELERRIEALERSRGAAPAITPVSGLPVPSQETHLVQEGETLMGISRRHGVSVVDLEKANRLLPGAVIRAGERLVIPGGIASPSPQPTPVSEPKPVPQPSPEPPAPPAVVPANWTGTHKVSNGETLSSIARVHGTTLAELARMNGIRDANLIRLGQSLRVPAGNAAVAKVPPTPTPTPAPPAPADVPQAEETYHYYDVAEGDTILAVATTFFTTPEEVARLNSIGVTTVLKVGQQLVVPTRRYFEEKKRQSEREQITAAPQVPTGR